MTLLTKALQRISEVERPSEPAEVEGTAAPTPQDGSVVGPPTQPSSPPTSPEKLLPSDKTAFPVEEEASFPVEEKASSIVATPESPAAQPAVDLTNRGNRQEPSSPGAENTVLIQPVSLGPVERAPEEPDANSQLEAFESVEFVQSELPAHLDFDSSPGAGICRIWRRGTCSLSARPGPTAR